MGELTLPADLPVALLPVRLETRFVGVDLQIRVYPDQIHVDSFEADLTAPERAAGCQYWESVWTAGEDAELVAWNGLADRYGAERAAWIVRVLEPSNLDARPDAAPIFPVLSVPAPKSAWTRAPLARALPTRWHAVGIPIDHPSLKVRATGKDITGPLAVGVTPGFDPSSIPTDQTPVDEPTRWLTDFDDAVERGMALTLPAPEELRLGGFLGYATLFVYGVCDAPDGKDGARRLSELLEAHHFTHGFTFLAQGVATNNAAGSNAAPSRDDPAYRSAYRPQPGAPAPLDKDSNGAVLARALGLPVTSVLAGTPGAADHEQRLADWMHTALWQVTWGYFLSQMIGPQVTDAQLRRLRRHIVDWIRPAGPLPALRIAAQPYGVLPVLAPPYVQRESRARDPEPLGEGTFAFLQHLRTKLWEPSIEAVPRIVDEANEETVLRILGMGAHAQAYYARSLLGMDYVANLWRFSNPVIGLGPDWRTDLTEAAAKLGRRLGMGDGWDPRVGRAVFATESFPIPGAPVQTTDGTSASTYLRDLAAESLPARTVADAIDNGTPQHTPLLYRLLRHGLLLEHAQAADRVRARAGLPSPVPEPELVDILPGPPTPTIWRRLAEQAPWAQPVSELTPNPHWERLAEALAYLAQARWDNGKQTEAVAALRNRAAVYERLAKVDRAPEERDRYRSISAEALVDVLRSRSADPAAGLLAGQRAAQILQELAGITDFTSLHGLAPNRHWERLATVLSDLAHAQRDAGQLPAGLEAMGQRVRIYQRLVAADQPADQRARIEPLLRQALLDEETFR